MIGFMFVIGFSFGFSFWIMCNLIRDQILIQKNWFLLCNQTLVQILIHDQILLCNQIPEILVRNQILVWNWILIRDSHLDADSD